MSRTEPVPAGTIPDLEPTPPDRRTSTAWEISGLWFSMVVGVPTYYLAGSLVELGMTWWQGLLTVFLANTILLLPLILNAHAGTRYGIPFPVLLRASFGIRGAHIPALLRAVIACGWFGIETWIGGSALLLLVPESVVASSAEISWIGASPVQLISYLVFWAIQMVFVLGGLDGVRKMEKYAAPVLLLFVLGLLAWAYVEAGGFGTMLGADSDLTAAEFWEIFFPSLTACIGGWATLALNISDFSRYARSQADQILGQVGLPIFTGGFTFVGLAVTSASKVIFGEALSNPIELIARIGGLIPAIVAVIGISLATLTTNIAANVVAPANVLVNLCPAYFNFRSGSVVASALGLFFQPWRVYGSSGTYMYTWLNGYAALLGPIGGIMIVDYWILRRCVLDVDGLYSTSRSGPYWYIGGFNLVAVVVMVAAILPIVPGFLGEVGVLEDVSAVFASLYDNAWFFTTFVAGFFHWGVSRLLVRRRSKENELYECLLS